MLAAILVLAARAALADPLALSNTRLAVGDNDELRIYTVPEGTLIASLPVSARTAHWDGDRLVMRLRSAVATWSEAEGLAVSVRIPVGENWTVGPDDLVYAWDDSDSVRVIDPWTGMAADLKSDGSHVNRAGADGYVDAHGLHDCEGHLVAAVDVDEIVGLRDC